MQEKLLQYIWQQAYFDTRQLVTQTGETVVIQDGGTWNQHQGPDFLQARLLLNGISWAGHIEIHLRSSHWNRHRHTGDPFYANVILHVVWEDDDPHLSSMIPTLVMQHRVSSAMLHRYETLMQAGAGNRRACNAQLEEISPALWEEWKSVLLQERLQRKAAAFSEVWKQAGHHWEEAGWRWLARHFGGAVNGEFFAQLARSISWTWLVRQRSRPIRVEAVLLGQANLIPPGSADPYVQELDREYRAACRLKAMPAVHGQVSRLRMRPAAFPDIRLAQLGALLVQCPDVQRRWLECSSWKDAAQLLDVTAPAFWNYHYQLEDPSPGQAKNLGEETIRNLIINAVVPMLYAYGQQKQLPGFRQLATKWWAAMPAETNQLVQEWQRLGMAVSSAGEGQACIELTGQYCRRKKCLQCRIGQQIVHGDDGLVTTRTPG